MGVVARPYAGDTVVVEAAPTVVAKPTVVYDKPKRIIYRKITCYSDDCDTSSNSVSSGSSRSFSSSPSTSNFTPTLNSQDDAFDDDADSTQIGAGQGIRGQLGVGVS